MAETPNALRDAFIEDHRTLTDGLTRILEALRANDLATAASVARQVDVAAGPHIDFEENVYYPQLAADMGDEHVEQLHHEHDVGLHAIRSLITRDSAEPLRDDERQTLVEQIQATLDHAISCGALLRHVTSLDPDRQTEILAALKEARGRGRRWTELHPAPADHPQRQR
jgi:hypothetical protein